MGEVFFKRLFVLFLLVVSLFSVMYAIKNNESVSEHVSAVSSSGVSNNLISGFVVHPLYSSFSAGESGFTFNNNSNLVSVTDTAIYKFGYYSINGGTWQSFSLSGSSYNGDANWLTGSTTATLPSFGVGEHYVIIYSCTYNSSNSSWDCHGNRWQLIVVNNTVSSTPSCSDGLKNGDETGIDCGGSCSVCSTGRIYYVSTSGSDSNNGLTTSTPWKTLQWAEAHATTPGDTIALKKGDVWSSDVQLSIHHGGTAEKPIVWDGNYWGAGSNAVIARTADGTDSTLYSVVNIKACQHLIFQNITVEGNNHYLMGLVIGGIDTVYGSSPGQNNESDITVQNCTLKDFGGTSSYQIGILVQPWNTNIDNIKLIGNNISNTGSHGISFYPCSPSTAGSCPGSYGISNSYIGYNTVTNYRLYSGNTGMGIHLNHKETNITVDHNIVTDTFGTNDAIVMDSQSDPGLYSTGIVIKYNRISVKVGNGIANYGGQPITADIYGNVITNLGTASYRGGIVIPGNAYNYTGGHINVYNNVIYVNGTASAFYDGSAVNGFSNFKNNILVGTGDGEYVGALIGMVTSGSIIHSNNNYWRTVSGNYVYAIDGNNYKMKNDMLAWEPSAVIANPLFVNIANSDFHLQSDSAVIGKGVAISGITKDYDGVILNNPPSIGAYEYTGVISQPNCSDGIKNQDETGVDCGGSCAACSPYLRTFYVSNSGSDLSNGNTSSTPWRTVSKVNNYTLFRPGDGILFERGGTWRETLTVPRSGNSTNYITFGNYGTNANRPKIYGSTKLTGWADQGGNIWKSSTSVVDPDSRSYPAEIFFEELDGSGSWGHVKKASTINLTKNYDWTWSSNYVYIYSTNNPNTAYSSIEAPVRDNGVESAAKEYFTLDGLDIRYCGLAGYKDLWPEANLVGLIIQNCDIGFVGTKSAAAAFGISAWHSNSLFKNNTIHDNGRRGLSLNVGTNPIGLKNIIIEDNYFYNGFHTAGPDISNSAGGAYDNITVRRNKFYGNIFDDSLSGPAGQQLPTGAEAYPAAGIYSANARPSSGGTVSNVYIYNNIFMNMTGSGISIYDLSSAYIYHNSFYGSNPTYGGDSASAADIYIGNSAIGNRGVVIKNNAHYGNTQRNNYQNFHRYSTDICSVDYNLYYQEVSSASIINLVGSGSGIDRMDQFAAYKSATGYDTNSPLPANPLFVSSSDLHLRAGSPAINAGIDVGIATDFDGNQRIGAPDIGAFEYTDS